jgi:hypothetical protein
VTLAHDRNSLESGAERRAAPLSSGRAVDEFVHAAVRRAASRERVRTRYRFFFLSMAGVALLGLVVGLSALFIELPTELMLLAGVASGLGSGALGILIGSRLEYQRRADRVRLLRRLTETEMHTSSREHDRHQ